MSDSDRPGSAALDQYAVGARFEGLRDLIHLAYQCYLRLKRQASRIADGQPQLAGRALSKLCKKDKENSQHSIAAIRSLRGGRH